MPERERKRMARLLIADVTLLKDTEVRAQVRFNGGATHTLHVPLSKPAWMLQQTPPTVVAEIDRLLQDNTDGEIAELLNRQGLTSGTGKRFHLAIIARIRIGYGLQSRYDRLCTRGMLTLNEIAKCLNVMPDTVKIWRRAGLLVAHRYNDKGQCLFEPPGADAPRKFRHQGKTRGRFAAPRQIATHATHEVQYAA